MNIYWIDLFAGGGGTSTGIHMANANAKVIACVNHDATAIASHKANHPHTLHFVEDIRDFKVVERLKILVTKLRRKEPDCYINIWASLECFTAGHLILTDKGLVPIENIKLGDFVFTHKNRFRKVTSIMSKYANTSTIKGQGHYGIETTSEHPFYIKKESKVWNNSIRNYDLITEEPSWMSLNEIGYSTHKYQNNPSPRFRWASPKVIQSLNIPIIDERKMDMEDPEFWWLIGRYLGDGSVSKGSQKEYHSLELCCGNHEIDNLRQKLKHFSPKTENRASDNELRWCERKLRTAHLFITSHKKLVKWVLDNFGHYSYDKEIPTWAYGLKEEFKRNLLEGYLSADGHKAKYRSQITTVSKKLAFGIKLLAQSIGINISIHHYNAHNDVIEGRKVNVRPVYVLTFNNNNGTNLKYDNDHVWGLVKKVEQTDKIQKVYNISVEEDESYVVDGIVVHNCTNYSKAKGGKPRDADSRTLAWDMLIYIEHLNPDYLYIENVREFMAWGKLDEKGRPVHRHKGCDYLYWVNSVKRFGYEYDWKMLNAADFGAYTSRDRYFGIFAKQFLPIEFPEPTHRDTRKKVVQGGMFSYNNLKPWKPVKEVLNFDIEGESIFERKTPLSDKTLERIYAGLIKFVAGGKDKWLLKYNSMNQAGKHNPPSIDEPAPVISTQGRLGIVKAAFLKKYYSGRPEGKVISVDGPAGTITTIDGIEDPHPTIVACRKQHYLMNPQFQSKGGSIEDPSFTLIARMDKRPPYLISTEHGQVAIAVYETDSDIMTKIKEFMAIYGIVDIKMRMLLIDELKLIQGFPKDYILKGTKTEQKKQIGNAVVPLVAQKLVEANYNSLNNLKKYIYESN